MYLFTPGRNLSGVFYFLVAVINTLFLSPYYQKTMMRLFFVGIVLLCFACKSGNDSEVQQETPKAKLDSLSKQKIDLNLLKLSPQAEKDLESLDDFKNLRSMIQYLRDANAFYVKKHADSINLLIETFDETLSKDLKVNNITSRITVLSTEAGLLQQVATKKNSDSIKIMEANKKLITAYNSLIIQLNELSLAIPENIEKELLRDLEKKDG